MRELGCHTGFIHLFVDNGFLPCLLFKGYDVVCKLFFLSVVSQIEQSKAHLAQTCHGCVEVLSCHNAVNEFVRHRFGRFVMEGKSAEEVFFYCKILHEL